MGRKAYKNTIDLAKRKHWNDFLANEKKDNVWTAHQFTKQRQPVRVPDGHDDMPEQTFKTIMNHLFAPCDNLISKRTFERKELGDGDQITSSEIMEVLMKCSNKSAPGPDQVPYSVWKNIHRIEESIIPRLMEDMLEWGIHPSMLKESIGVILRKPGKKDYTDCKSFRVIALMQTFLKIVEWIVHQRLITIAYKTDMYCINQTESLPQRSMVDAAMSLNYWIRESQAVRKKVSSVFLDIKGGFNNVNHNKLLDILSTDQNVPVCLVDWISNIIHTREIVLAYPGSLRTQQKVNKGIPQGSPLLP